MSSNEVLSSTIECPELQVKNFCAAPVRVAPQFDLEQLPPTTCLLAVSNSFGFAAFPVNDDTIGITPLDSLKDSLASTSKDHVADFQPPLTIKVPGKPTNITFAMDDRILLVVSDSESPALSVFRLKTIVDGTNANPVHQFPLSTSKVDIVPNPLDRPELVAMLVRDRSGPRSSTVHMLHLESMSDTATFAHGTVRACWSIKGKQLVCGKQDGSLVQYTPDGTEKVTVPPPPSLEGSFSVIDVRWIENDVFLVAYAPSDPSNMDPTVLYSISRGKTSIEYTKFDDDPAADTFVWEGREERRSAVHVRNWPPFKHLFLCASSLSNVLFPIRADIDTQPSPWSIIDLDESSLPLLPSSKTDGSETCPLGMAIDIRVNVTEPTVFVLSSDGTINSWKLVNTTGNEIADSVKTRSVIDQEAPPQSKPQQQSATTSTSPSNAFSTPAKPFASSGSNAFSSSPLGTKPAFGSTSFGSSSSPAFGSNTFGSSSFSSSATKPPASGGGFSQFGGGGFASAASATTNTTGSSGFASFAQKPDSSAASIFDTQSSTNDSSASSKPSGFSSFSQKPSSFSFRDSSNDQDDDDEDQKKPPMPVKEELEESEEPKQQSKPAFSAFAPPSTGASTTGFGAFASKKSTDENKDSDTTKSTSAPIPTTTTATAPAFASPTTPTTSPSKTTSPAFGSTGFGSFSSGKQTGFGSFTSPSKPGSSSFSFGFGSTSPEQPKTKTLEKEPEKDDEKEKEKEIENEEKDGKEEKEEKEESPVSPTEDKEGLVDARKVLGFASSPPPKESAPTSIFDRFSGPLPSKEDFDEANKVYDDEGEEVPEEEEEEEVDEEYDEEYDDEYDEEEEGEDEDEVEDEEDEGYEEDEEEIAQEREEAGLQKKETETEEDESPDMSVTATVTTQEPPKPKFFGGFPNTFPRASSPLATAPAQTAKEEDEESEPGTPPRPKPGLFSFAQANQKPASPVINQGQPKPTPPLQQPLQQQPIQSFPPTQQSVFGISTTSKQETEPKPPSALFGQPQQQQQQSQGSSLLQQQQTSPSREQKLSNSTPVAPSTPPQQTDEAPRPRFSPLSTTVPPKMELPMASKSGPKGDGIASEFVRICTLMEEDCEILRTNTKVCIDFVEKYKKPLQTSEQVTSFDDRDWVLGDLNRFTNYIKDALTNIEEISKSISEQEQTSKELKSSLYKSEKKREETARHIRARRDPEFARWIKVRQLGPEQAENQRQIRQSVMNVENTLEQLERRIYQMKEDLMDSKKGPHVKAPSMDTITRAIRNITGATLLCSGVIDEMRSRIDQLRLQQSSGTNKSILSTEDKSFFSKPVERHGNVISTPRRDSSRSTKVDHASRAIKTINASKLKDRIVDAQKEPLFNTCSKGRQASQQSNARTSSSSSDLKQIFSQGPILAKRLPVPRSRPRSPDENQASTSVVQSQSQSQSHSHSQGQPQPFSSSSPLGIVAPKTFNIQSTPPQDFRQIKEWYAGSDNSLRQGKSKPSKSFGVSMKEPSVSPPPQAPPSFSSPSPFNTSSSSSPSGGSKFSFGPLPPAPPKLPTKGFNGLKLTDDNDEPGLGGEFEFVDHNQQPPR